MYSPVPTKDPKAVEREVQRLYREIYPSGGAEFVGQPFGWVTACFTGRYPGYQAIDARYHDLEHTMQGTLCMARLLHGRARVSAEPPLTQHQLHLGLVAILLHDTGYLKRSEDRSGTGAKYTITHVSRSAEFARELLAQKGYPEENIQAVQSMIRCTGLNARLNALPFANLSERIAGYALATADLMGQMAADDYVDKLPILFSEFAEASTFTGDRSHFISTFTSAEDLIARTSSFWEGSIRPKLDTELLGLWRFLNDPYPDGPNDYIDRIEANMKRLKKAPGVKPALARQ